MKVYNLTRAHIQEINIITNAILKVSLLDIKNIETYPYLLIVQSTIENSIKLSIYPLKRNKIIKVTFSGFNFSNQNIDNIIGILQNFQIIHTSGALVINEQLFYECYLNLSINDIKFVDLKASLDKIKNIFKEVIIEEIGLKKSK
ncbi:MAG: hypothetical protein ACFFDY_02910 [Candidatus Thorarchaeota archaeon]